ncbi:MAG: hypothetical protein RBR14_06600 [Candidatus Cloacimonas acidaminovorans]|nr:hypothetical protein [Candidatus Cloacimonas acidaminovorans]
MEVKQIITNLYEVFIKAMKEGNKIPLADIEIPEMNDDQIEELITVSQNLNNDMTNKYDALYEFILSMNCSNLFFKQDLDKMNDDLNFDGKTLRDIMKNINPDIVKSQAVILTVMFITRLFLTVLSGD